MHLFKQQTRELLDYCSYCLPLSLTSRTSDPPVLSWSTLNVIFQTKGPGKNIFSYPFLFPAHISELRSPLLTIFNNPPSFKICILCAVKIFKTWCGNFLQSSEISEKFPEKYVTFLLLKQNSSQVLCWKNRIKVICST